MFILRYGASLFLLSHIQVTPGGKGAQEARETVVEALEHACEVTPRYMLLSVDLTAVSEA